MKSLNLQQAFETIYRENYPRVRGFLFRLSRDEDLTEELTQETFYRAFQKFQSYRGDSTMFTWLASISKFTYYEYLRKHKLGLDTISLESVVETYCQAEEDPETQILSQAVYAGVRDLLHTLPQNYRDVIILRIYAELSFRQVGEAMGISENSAKVLYYRAKMKLKEKLDYANQL